MTSNYNELFLPSECFEKYKEGQVYKLDNLYMRICNYKLLKFHGLTIKSVSRYLFWTKLTFDWNEWENNNPDRPKCAEKDKLHQVFKYRNHENNHN